MAFTSKSGERFTNPHQARLADKHFDAKEVEKAVPSVVQDEDESGEPSDVVAQHGPAHTIVVKHADKHTVDSSHSDGHKHHSEHESASDAHQAAATLGGADQGQPSDDQSLSDMNPSSIMMGQ